MGYTVGRVIEVKGLSVKAKLDHLFPPYIVEKGHRESSPQINGFVKSKVGIETIICQVIGEYSQEYAGEVSGHYLELQVKGNLAKGEFIQGLRMLPIVSGLIETLDAEDYKMIYKSYKNALPIGVDLYDNQKEINVSINKIIPSHIGIFGNTGSGKSNTLVRILHEYTHTIERYVTNRGKIIVFDVNNEYAGDSICNMDQKVIYSLTTKCESTKKIPFSIANLTEEQFILLTNASEKTQIPIVKQAYKYTFDTEQVRDYNYYLNLVKSIIKNGRKSLFLSLRHHLSAYFTNLDNFKYHNKNGDFYYEDNFSKIYSTEPSFQSCLDRITLRIPETKIDRFLFELYFAIAYENENGVQLDFMMPLVSRTNKLLGDLKKVFDLSEKETESSFFEGKNVCVVQLGNVNGDMKEIIPSILSSYIFDKLASKKDVCGEVVQIVNIILDEAHNVLYDDNRSIPSHQNVLQTFEKIVKEGRKFGCYLNLASQRPSDISQTIISQLHNYFIHKLVNPSDIMKIRKAVAYLDDHSLDFITVLGPGECIVSGTAFQMPTFLYVNQVDKRFRPNSENVILCGQNGLFEKDNTDIFEL